MVKYANRREAGKILAKALLSYANRDDLLVLALPRGGVPVAYEVAKALHMPLDVFIVRKLGAPYNEELAIGAVALHAAPILNQDLIQELQVSQAYLKAIIAKEQEELKRRNLAYRHNRPFPSFKDKTVMLIDDGIATGATMRAAISAIHELGATAVVIAVPVADDDMCRQLQPLVDDLICPLRPKHFHAVGSWYEDFSQTEDLEVFDLLGDFTNPPT